MLCYVMLYYVMLCYVVFEQIELFDVVYESNSSVFKRLEVS